MFTHEVNHAWSHQHGEVSCNTAEDPFCRICMPNKIEDVNLKVFNIIKGINESHKSINKCISKTLIIHNSYECRCEFDGRKCKSRQKWNNNKYQ